MLDIHEIVSVSFKFELEQPSGHMALLECDFQHTGNNDGAEQTSADEFSILWKNESLPFLASNFDKF